MPLTLRENEYNQTENRWWLLLSKWEREGKSQNHGPNSGVLYQPTLYISYSTMLHWKYLSNVQYMCNLNANIQMLFERLCFAMNYTVAINSEETSRTY